jgi:fatty-acyl-CoA synthase
VLAVVPMFHANAWGLPYNAGMVGAKLVFPGPRMGDAPTLTQLMNEEKVTLAAAVPTVWTMLLHHLQQSGAKLETLERTVIGGSAVPLQMIRDFRDRHGVTVVQGWGMTETSPLGSVSTLRPEQLQLPAEDQVLLRGRAGHGIFGISMKIVDDNGAELPWDGVSSGELKVRGPWVCKGYFRLDHSPAHDEDGWFATGDVAAIHPNGFLQITDRAKDVIKSGGEWISSVDLENCACGHPDVMMAAAIGVKHPKWEEPRAPRRALRQVAVARHGAVHRRAAAHRDRQDQQAFAARYLRQRAAGRLTGQASSCCSSACDCASVIGLGTG